jgi:hypothetical protein
MQIVSSASAPAEKSDQHRRPRFSDDLLLGCVCRLGRWADFDSIRVSLHESIGAEISRDYVEDRVQRLRCYGLLRVAYGRGMRQHFALTAMGLERLHALESEAISPDSE